MPLLGPALALATGILLSSCCNYRGVGAGLLVLGCLLLPYVGLSIRKRTNIRIGQVSGVLLFLSIGTFGFTLAGLRYAPNQTDYFARNAGPGDLIEGRVTAIRPTARRLQFRLEITGVLDTAGQRRVASGLSLVYVLPDEAGAAVGVGDRLVINAEVQPITGPLNPEAVDFRSYWAGQGIFHQLRLKDEEGFVRIPSEKQRSVADRAGAMREAWLATLRPYLQGDELAVAAALVLGKKDLLSSDVKSAYADTGAIHVLAVSGLHVGIVAIIFTTLLGGRNARSRKRRWINAILTVVGVWCFALVTGFSPSVQRAAIMFSVLILGNVLRRRASLFNLLSLAAIVMLLWQPRQLFQVGFQLSFLAVAGIGVFARPLGELVAVTQKFLRAIWSALVVSTSAQLGTLPLSLHYFGRFPLYFLLSGTLVVLSAYVILCLGMFHGLVAGVIGWPALAAVSGGLLNFIVELQNAFIHFFGQLPGAVVEINGVGWGTVVLLTLLLILFGCWLYWRRQSVATVFLTISILMAGVTLYGWLSGPPAPSAIIYHLPRASLLDVYAAGGIHPVGTATDPTAVERAAAGLRKTVGGRVNALTALSTVDSVVAANLSISYPLIEVLGQRVLVLDGRQPPLNFRDFPTVNLIWITNGFRPDRFPENTTDGTPVLLVDGSSPAYLLEDWATIARERKWLFHATSRDGAYRLPAKTR